MSERNRVLGWGPGRAQAAARIRADLEAYHDHELSWWRRHRVEAGLRRSPELRRELDMLRQMNGAAATVDAAIESPDLWGAISSQLGAIDAERRAVAAPALASAPVGETAATLSTRLAGSAAGLFDFFTWKPLGLAVAAGAAALAIGLWDSSNSLPQSAQVAGVAGSTQGALRYLDTSGLSVVVVDEPDVTIIWLLDGGAGTDGAWRSSAAAFGEATG